MTSPIFFDRVVEITSGALTSGQTIALGSQVMQGYRGFSGTVVDGVTTQVTIDDGSTFSVVQGIYSGNRFAPGLTLATTNSGAFNSPQFIFISPDAGVLNSLTSGATIGLTSGQVTSGFIGNAAVVSGSYASGSIGPFALASGTALGNIASGTITQNYLASGVGGGGGGALTSGQVQSGDIGNNAVTSGNYASGSIGQYALASGVGGGGSFSFTSGCVPSGSLASPVVFSGNIASGQVGTSAIGSGQVLGNNIGAAAITSGLIASGAIGQFALSSGTALGNIASGTITQNYLASGVGGGGASLGSGSIQSGMIALGAVTSGDIASGAFATSLIVSGMIASGAVGQYHLSSGTAIYNIQSGSITSTMLASGVAGTPTILSGTITGFDIASGTIQQLNIVNDLSVFWAGSVTPFNQPWGNNVTNTVVTAGELFSGSDWAICFNQSGNVIRAMASVSGRMPAVGWTNAGPYASGSQMQVYVIGVGQTTNTSFSGNFGQPVYVGRSGQIVVASGSFNSGGFQSGDIIQQMGVAFASGLFMLNVCPAFQAASGSYV